MRLTKALTFLFFATLVAGCAAQRESVYAVNWDNMGFTGMQCDPNDPTCSAGKITTDRILGSRGK